MLRLDWCWAGAEVALVTGRSRRGGAGGLAALGCGAGTSATLCAGAGVSATL